MERFFAARGVEEFSRDLALAWVDEACGFFDKEQTGTLKPTDVYVFRVVQMLGDYAVHGAVRCRYSRSISRLAGGGVDAVARFQAWLRTADRAASTVRTYTTVAGEFVAFLDTRGGMARCDGGAVEAFVATSAGYQCKTVEQKLCALRVGAEKLSHVMRPARTRVPDPRVGLVVAADQLLSRSRIKVKPVGAVVEVHDQVAGLLGRPGPGRVDSDHGDMHVAGCARSRRAGSPSCALPLS